MSDVNKLCTCPSGDGSLRWPCPSHPPEKEKPKAEESSNQRWLWDMQKMGFRMGIR
jgi:hypothetical protein